MIFLYIDLLWKGCSAKTATAAMCVTVQTRLLEEVDLQDFCHCTVVLPSLLCIQHSILNYKVFLVMRMHCKTCCWRYNMASSCNASVGSASTLQSRDSLPYEPLGQADIDIIVQQNARSTSVCTGGQHSWNWSLNLNPSPNPQYRLASASTSPYCLGYRLAHSPFQRQPSCRR